MRDDSKLYAGIILIIAGVLILLKSLGVLSFTICSSFETYWPVGIILIGLALMFRKKALATVFLLLTITLGVIYVAGNFEGGERREVLREIPLEDTTDLDLQLGFGAGEITIVGGSDSLVDFKAQTADVNDPMIYIEKELGEQTIKIERDNPTFRFWGHIDDKWEIEVNSGVMLSLDLDYGAADVTLDLKELKVTDLDIDSGATSTSIVFGSYPAKVDIDTGASSIDLEFPAGAGVAVHVNGGAVSTNLNGFRKEGNYYYSPDYDESKENIEIDIDAGATSIDGRFY